MTDEVHPRAALVVGAHHGPGGGIGVGLFQHLVALLRIVVPFRQRGYVHIRKLPALQRAVAAIMEALDLRFATDVEPEFEKIDVFMGQHLFQTRRFLEEELVFFRRAETHDRLDPGAVIP
ncbi:hypothetical protein D3C86_1793650 [compost metagenome]